MGDHVIVINAEKIRVTGMKADQKLYRRYTGFPGGLREETFVKLLARRPEEIVEAGHQGHAAEVQARPADGDQAEGLQGRRSSAPRTAAHARSSAQSKVQGPGKGHEGSLIQGRTATKFWDLGSVMADLIQYYGTGRRKSSIARVFLRPGCGKFTVNGNEFDEYFVTPAAARRGQAPLGIAGHRRDL